MHVIAAGPVTLADLSYFFLLQFFFPPSILQIIAAFPLHDLTGAVFPADTVIRTAAEPADNSAGQSIPGWIGKLGIPSASVSLTFAHIQPLIRPKEQLFVHDGRKDIFMDDPFRGGIGDKFLAFKVIMRPVLDHIPFVDRIPDNFPDDRWGQRFPVVIGISLLKKDLRAAVCPVTFRGKLINQSDHLRFPLFQHHRFIRELAKTIGLVRKDKALTSFLPVSMCIVDFLAEFPTVFFRQNRFYSCNQRIIRRIKFSVQIDIQPFPVFLHPIQEQIPVLGIAHQPVLGLYDDNIKFPAFQVTVKPLIFAASLNRCPAFCFYININQNPSLLRHAFPCFPFLLDQGLPLAFFLCAAAVVDHRPQPSGSI